MCLDFKCLWWDTSAILLFCRKLSCCHLSEIDELMPCKWCWFQRCAMYPLAIIFVVGVAKGDKEQSMRSYATPIAILGLMASIWHYLVQQVPALSDAESWSFSTPCAITYLEKFGFISIPWMAGSVFLLTIVLLLGFCSPEGSTRWAFMSCLEVGS